MLTIGTLEENVILLSETHRSYRFKLEKVKEERVNQFQTF